MTYPELKAYCQQNSVEMIDFKMIDLRGKWRHLTIPAARLTEKLMTGGVGFDGSNYGFAAVEKSDMVFIPDLSTTSLEPFTSVKTLSMIGDVYVIGEPYVRFEQDPRYITGKAEAYMRDKRVADEIRIGPEFEFYVFDKVGYEVAPQGSSFFIDAAQAGWNSANPDGRGFTVRHKGGYH
ncbi:MAG: glutamine synthetase beta-grasp domain-containing protein, partial [Oscillospiraceae bacterium]|nr:glutamine synthetase beta-grasp domain-containing protein [Oscillospiraceae bacterium]